MEATDEAKAGQGAEASKRCSPGAARDNIKQKETKGSPRLSGSALCYLLFQIWV